MNSYIYGILGMNELSWHVSLSEFMSHRHMFLHFWVFDECPYMGLAYNLMLSPAVFQYHMHGLSTWSRAKPQYHFVFSDSFHFSYTSLARSLALSPSVCLFPCMGLAHSLAPSSNWFCFGAKRPMAA